MATWTTPVTRVTNFFVTAAVWDAEHVDNLPLTLHVVARKSVDETVTSSGTPQNDDHLFFSIGASETWTFRLYLITNNGNVTNSAVKGAWTVPAGATGSWVGGFSSTGLRIPLALAFATTANWDYITASDTIGFAEGTVTTTGTAGTVQFQWAQSVSNGTGSIVRTNSHILAAKLL